MIDGCDIAKVELYSLRRQIGIVPQDPLLFSGTVSENIALTNPEASSEEIVRAARPANAHDFIMNSSGYSTPVGEGGFSQWRPTSTGGDCADSEQSQAAGDGRSHQRP